MCAEAHLWRENSFYSLPVSPEGNWNGVLDTSGVSVFKGIGGWKGPQWLFSLLLFKPTFTWRKTQLSVLLYCYQWDAYWDRASSQTITAIPWCVSEGSKTGLKKASTRSNTLALDHMRTEVTGWLRWIEATQRPVWQFWKVMTECEQVHTASNEQHILDLYRGPFRVSFLWSQPATRTMNTYPLLLVHLPVVLFNCTFS